MIKEALVSFCLTFAPVEHTSVPSEHQLIFDIAKCVKQYNEYSNTLDFPVVLAAAQAMHESNWGLSRFAREGNNYYGMKTWDLTRPHIKIQGMEDANFGMRAYPNLCFSVADYMELLLTSKTYTYFREVLARGDYTWEELLEGLDDYATDVEYRAKVIKMIYKIQEIMDLAYG